MTRYSTLFVFSMMLFATACVTPVDVDFVEAEQELVVYSHFGVDEPMQIYLSHTRNPLKPNEPFEPVEGATIEIYRDGVLERSFNEMPDRKSGYAAYETDVYPMNGSEYRIEIAAEGYKNARAIETVPHHKADMESFRFLEEIGENEIYQLLFTDDNSTENYYQLVVKLVKYSRENVIIAEEIVDYEFADGYNFTHFELENSKEWMAIYPEYEGFLFTGVRQTGDFKELLVEISDRGMDFESDITYQYKAELHNVSDAYYLYHQSIQSQLTDNSSLNEPVRIYNNIEGGFGNFSAYNMEFAETEPINE